MREAITILASIMFGLLGGYGWSAMAPTKTEAEHLPRATTLIPADAPPSADDKAWAARTITNDRMAALTRQIAADRRVIEAYTKEYELGQRSLIDLLNAQNQYFNAAVSLTSARGVIVFADYQLLAAMGTLLEYLKAPPPVDAAPLDTLPYNFVPYKLPTVRLTLPDTGSEPLVVATAAPEAVVRAYASADPQPQKVETVEAFGERWPRWSVAARLLGAAEWFAAKQPGQPVVYVPAEERSQAYASTQSGKKPHWLLSAFPQDQK